MAEGFDRKSYDPESAREPVARRRKHTRLWCRGKVGVEHKPVIVVPPNSPSWRQTGSSLVCRWITWGKEPWWLCSHVKLCSVCGKELQYRVECPDRAPFVDSSS